jgi:hypothetical protein
MLFLLLVFGVACQKGPAPTPQAPAKPAASQAAAQAPTPAAAPEVKPVPAQLPTTIAKVNGEAIGKDEFERAVPELVKIAFDDPSWRPTNPRMPVMSELADLLWSAYRGRGLAKAAGAAE